MKSKQQAVEDAIIVLLSSGYNVSDEPIEALIKERNIHMRVQIELTRRMSIEKETIKARAYTLYEALKFWIEFSQNIFADIPNDKDLLEYYKKHKTHDNDNH